MSRGVCAYPLLPDAVALTPRPRQHRYLSNVHVKTRSIYMTRHGESIYNTLHRIGGDSMLSPRGEVYAERLKQFMEKCV